MITPTVTEIDIRKQFTDPQVIRFADDYQKQFAGACVLEQDPVQAGVLYIKNEGYSRVGVASAEQACNLIKALERAIDLGWIK